MSLAIAREYLDLVKFHHTLFALPFALLGAALAAWSRTRLEGESPGLGRDPPLHGHGPLGRDGVQSPGGPRL